MYKKAKQGMAYLLCICMGLGLTGCGFSASSSSKPSIYLDTYSKMEYDYVTVQSGDISPVFELELNPDEYEVNSYSIEQSDYEVGEVLVAEGDKVEAGDILIQFKADEIQETIDEYTTQKEEAELLKEHYQKLAAIEGTDYSDEIAELNEEINVAETYISEQSDRYSEYALVAEKAGTVTYINEYLEYGYVSSNETLIKVASGSSNYTAQTTEEYEFKEGDIFTAEFDIAKYEMKVVSVTSKFEEATGKTIQTIVFEPTEDMSGVSITETLTMTIEKDTIKDVVYVTKKAVNETTDGEGYFVYVLDDEGYRNAVEVTIGDTVDGMTIITSGLEAGEQVTIN